MVAIAGMRKTTVYLKEGDLRALKRLAKHTGRSEAELIREAIGRYTRSVERPRLRSLGIAAGPRKLSQRVDTLLASGFGKDDVTNR